MNIRAIADQTIPKALNTKVLINKAGATRDIIKEVLECYGSSRLQLTRFAPHLKGATVPDTCANIWNFWKQNIRYQVDAEGVQWIKTPAAVWATKFCDCKSFSVAVACTLDALGIAGKFRFTSYGDNETTPTHVYVVAIDRGREIIIDCVYTAFDREKEFTKNWDYNMTSIFRISGFEPATKKYAVGELNIDVNDPHTTEAEMDLALRLQGLELEQRIMRRKHAIGSVHDNCYQLEIEAHKAAIGAIGLFRSKKKQLEIAKKKNDGKGVSKKQAKLLAKAGVVVKKRRDGLLKRVAKGIKKVITTPIRLAAKTQLPKNAQFFLYIFITDPKVLAKLPAPVAAKRAKALQYKKILVDKLQMKESNFTSTIRNGIMNNTGQTPEALLAQWMKDANYVAGIGVIPPEVLKKGLEIAAKGLKLLLGKLGENLQADIEQYTPVPEDWSNMTEAQRQALAMQTTTTTQPLVTPTSGGYVTLPPSSYSSDGLEDPNNSANWYHNGDEWVNRATGETSLNDPRTLENVDVKSIIKKAGDDGNDTTVETGNNTMLYLGLGGIALLVLGASKSKKK